MAGTTFRAFWLSTLAIALAACDREPEALPVPTIVDPPRETSAPEIDADPDPDPDPDAETARSPDPAAPPPPPPAPTFRDTVRDEAMSAPVGETVLVPGAAGPREALFLHVVGDFRGKEEFRARPLCLRQTDEAMVQIVSARFENIHADGACSWAGPGVVLTATGDPAAWVHAAIDCDGRACSAEGGATYGNIGAEGYGYRLRRTREGWTVEKLGIMWIS